MILEGGKNSLKEINTVVYLDVSRTQNKKLNEQPAIQSLATYKLLAGDQK